MVTVDVVAQANESFEEFKKRKQMEFSNYREQRNKEFEEFRRQRNEEFAKFLRERWSPVEPHPAVPKPKDDTVPPVVIPDDDKKPVSPPAPNPVPYDEVLPVPRPEPQPQPVEPIEEIPEPVVSRQKFTFFGTACSVRFNPEKRIKIKTLNENGIADVWLALSDDCYTNLIYDCLQIRKDRNLCDWAYLMMLKEMANAVCGKNTNEAELLMAYVYCQSGYKMRLGFDAGKLYMLFASAHFIYELPRFDVSGEYYYPLDRKVRNIYVCEQRYPKEQTMSLYVGREMKLDVVATPTVSWQSKRNADMKVTVSVNKNLLDFFSSYPTSMIGDNLVSRWAMYADTPISESVKKQIYPQLRAAINNCDQWTAANKILNFVQTAFVYRLDDEVWGGDRAFFAEETLFYPYCDCEDRSILLTRLIRDLLGLRCMLVFYPGHLASAIEFTEGSPTGDCFLYNGHRFFIADGTITGYGAPVGMTMPDMDNNTAKVIVLE